MRWKSFVPPWRRETVECFDLPPELREVERRLAEREKMLPAAALRERVLAAMRDARTSKKNAWQFAVVAAASLLLILNLALSVANQRAWSETQRIESEGVEATARTLRQRHPDLSEPEAYQLALLLHSPPALPPSLPPIFLLEGEPSWDMR
jgi:hypothetical protein